LPAVKDVVEILVTSKQKIFYVLYEAEPAPGSGLETEYTGAMIRAWIQAESPKLARNQFVEEVREAGWEVVNFEEAVAVTREDFEHSEEDLELFKASKEEGAIYSIHAWSAQEEE
jgi:hypothetical protein